MRPGPRMYASLPTHAQARTVRKGDMLKPMVALGLSISPCSRAGFRMFGRVDDLPIGVPLLARITPLSEYALLVEFGSEISVELNERALAFAEVVERDA